MTRHNLTIRLPGITLTPVNYSFGLPPGYSMQRVMEQVAGATFTPDAYRDLEVKAWENYGQTTGLPVDPKRRISVTALSRGILSI